MTYQTKGILIARHSNLAYLNHHLGVSKNCGTPKWMVKIMENPIKMDHLGVPPFKETIISYWDLPLKFVGSLPTLFSGYSFQNITGGAYIPIFQHGYGHDERILNPFQSKHKFPIWKSSIRFVFQLQYTDYLFQKGIPTMTYHPHWGKRLSTYYKGVSENSGTPKSSILIWFPL